MYLEPAHRVVSGGEVRSLGLTIAAEEALPCATAGLQHVEAHQDLVSLIPEYVRCFDGQVDLHLVVQLQLCGSCRLVEDSNPSCAPKCWQ